MNTIFSRIVAYDLSIVPKLDVLDAARTLQRADGSYSDVDYKPVKLFFPAIVHLERLAELVLARSLEATEEEILSAMHPHPTMSEAVMEAAAAADGKAIHIPNVQK